MANVIYAGTEDGKAHKAKAIYIGNNGAAKKAKKIYVGVNGQAKLAWSGFTGKWIIPVVKYDNSPSTYGQGSSMYKQTSRFAVYSGNSLLDDELNGKFVRSSILKTSSDAIWGLTINSVCSGNGVYIITLGGSDAAFNQIYRSTDGINWTLVVIPNPDSSHGYDSNCSMCKFINGKFYFMYKWTIDTTHYIGFMSSNDGIIWTKLGHISFSKERYPDDLFYANVGEGVYKWFLKVRTEWKYKNPSTASQSGYELYLGEDLNSIPNMTSSGWSRMLKSSIMDLCGVTDLFEVSGDRNFTVFDMIQNDITGDIWFAMDGNSGTYVFSIQTSGVHWFTSETSASNWRQLVNNGDGIVAMNYKTAFIYPSSGDISNPTRAYEGSGWVGYDSYNTYSHRNAVIIPIASGDAYSSGLVTGGAPGFHVLKWLKNSGKGYGNEIYYYISDSEGSLSGSYMQVMRNHNQAFCLGKG